MSDDPLEQSNDEFVLGGRYDAFFHDFTGRHPVTHVLLDGVWRTYVNGQESKSTVISAQTKQVLEALAFEWERKRKRGVK